MINKVPPKAWFSIENYSNLSNYVLADWQRLVSDRVGMYHIAFGPDSAFHGYSHQALEETRQDAYAWWESIRKNGSKPALLNSKDKNIFNRQNNFWDEFRKIITPKKFVIGGLRDLTEFDLINEVLDLPNIEEIRDEYSEYRYARASWFSTASGADFSLLKKREVFQNKYSHRIAYPGAGFLEINLNASDEQLKDNFSAWLANERELVPDRRATRVTSRDFEEWVSNKLVQFFDLTALAKLDGATLPNHLVGNILFPDAIDIDVAERVRRVLRPKMLKLFSEDMVSLLTAQVEEGTTPEREK